MIIDQAGADALLSATHSDVFSVLGMHPSSTGNQLVVRALIPNATAIDVIASKGKRRVASLQCIDEAGLFEGTMGRRRKLFDYSLRVCFDGVTVEIDDAYRFPSLLDENDLYLFCEGTHERLYQWMGAHPREIEGVHGVLFTVWAPAAKRVSVVGDFNHWDGRRHVMRPHPGAGVWEIFIPGVDQGELYKFEVLAANGELLPRKADPYAFAMQHPPETASVTCGGQSYPWNDSDWMTRRSVQANPTAQPISIYEVHLGSWRRSAENGGAYLGYTELAEQLVPYVVEMGFTHLQLMPVTEYPFDGSWGYQPIGMYAPTSRFGSPDDFRYFVDCCHANNIGVLLDWVPAHFPTDEHGLGRFDGSCLYEHEDVRKGFHPDWNTLIYNYSRREVVSYLLSNAMYWLSEFHLDGLRVDAVASMLYLDYSREEGEWLPNEHGGRENLEAISLLQEINRRVYFNHPGVMMIAEESTAWPGVSRPVDMGGLGFGFKWNMGWMNDTLGYIAREPVHRQYHHNELTFGLVYAFSENFILPLSHDEVVHGKGSLIEKMPGDDWQKFANLRAYLGFMWTHPGKQLLFMGGEFAQRAEWNHDTSLDWHLLEQQGHRGIQRLVQDLNRLYAGLPALYELDSDGNGFQWIESEDFQRSILVFLRKARDDKSVALVVVNMTPDTYEDYRVGLPKAGHWFERFNSDSNEYGGSNMGNFGGVSAEPIAWNDFEYSVSLSVPPLATMVFECQQ